MPLSTHVPKQANKPCGIPMHVSVPPHTLSTSCCSVMVCVLAVRCIWALPHTRQPALGGLGTSDLIRAVRMPRRRLPVLLGTLNIKLLVLACC